MLTASRSNYLTPQGIVRPWALLLCAWLLSACSLTPHASSPPKWVHEPGEGVSTSAGFHAKGRQAQEDLAISRAREEFSKRYGVKISSDNTITQVVANDRQATISHKDIREEVRGNEVRAVVKDKWRDPVSDTLWVWLVPYK